MHKFLIFAAIFISFTMQSQVIVNEYSAANYSDFDDNYNETEDWFELYNSGSTDIDLTGYYLTDKPNNLTKFQINSNVVIPAGDYLTVFASGRDEIIGSDIHTNFKIHQTKGNEWIIITNPDGATIEDSIFVTPNLMNHSTGRLTDGNSTWAVFTDPTPGNTNTNAFTAYTSKPTFSLDPGSYSSNQSLSISNEMENTTIYYTTDGSYPTPSSSVYTTPLSITNTTVVKAIAVSDNESYLNSFVEYATYFIDETFSVPILSVSGDQLDNLLNGDGSIKPVGTIEYFKNGTLVDKAMGEYNEHGNDSWGYPQRGFDYITRDQFGYNHAIQDEIFRTKDRDKYQRLIIKAAANDNYPFSYGASGAHIRDAYVQSLSQVADLRMDERSYEPCILFLNGDYWGLYEIREKVDDIDFTDYYYDQDEGEVDYLKTWGGTWIEYGTDTGWTNIQNFILSNDMADEDNYDHAKSFYNTGSLIDYFILNTYVVNADWLNWNTSWWRGTNPDGDKKKWRYTLWDMDNTFDHGANYTGIDDQSSNADPCDPESSGDPGGQGHIPIWNALLQNDDFFADYINRWTDLSNNYFSCDYLTYHLDSLIGIIEPEMPAQINRWGGDMNTWTNNVQNMREFIEDRCESINSGILDCYEDEYGIEGPYSLTIILDPLVGGTIEYNGFDLPEDIFTGSYFGGVTQELSATPDEAYLFDYFEFTSGAIYEESDITYTLTQNDTIIVHFEEKSNLALDVIPNGTIIVDGIQYSSFPDTLLIAGEVSIEAIPEPNFYFVYWQLNNGQILDEYSSSTVINCESDANLVAVFAEYPTLSLQTNPNGSIVVDGISYSNLPEDISIYNFANVEAIAEEGYEFAYWEYNGSFISDINNAITSISVLDDCELTAHFTQIEIDIIFDISIAGGADIYINNELLSPIPSNYTVLYGDVYEIEVVCNDNFELAEWISNETEINNASNASISLSFSTSDTIVANLEEFFFLSIDIIPDGYGAVFGNGIELLELPLNQRYSASSNIRLESSPTIDTEFKYWTRGNDILENEFSYDYTIERNDTLNVHFVEKEVTLLIPNSFTPNGDLINDNFKPIGDASKITNYTFKVYNKWGQVVFETTDFNSAWNGPSHTENNNNTYIYFIELESTLTKTRYVYKGTVLVL